MIRAAAVAAGVAALALAACAPVPPPARAPATPPPAPSGARFAPLPPARMVLEERPLGFSPDGLARWLVRVTFRAADGSPTRLEQGGDIDFAPSRGTAQWQTRARFDGPAAIVSTDRDGPLALAVRANAGVALAPVRVRTDTRAWRLPRIVARALGPHEIRIGWFPASFAPVEVRRDGGTTTLVTPPSSSFTDPTVRPGRQYRYGIIVPGRASTELSVRVPSAPAHAGIAVLSGKAMWLSFSPVADDPDSFLLLRPAALVAQAAAAGLSALELRTTYGEFDEITPQDRPTVDALLDAAAARRIAVLAWTVPRGTNFEDLAGEVAVTAHRTPRGNGFAALAVDLERGDFFLGAGARGYAALRDYTAALRAALGPEYPLVATVEDPFLEHLDNADYPYAAIAASADALQPMTYWRMLSRRAVTPATVRAALRGSYAETLRQAGRALPIDLGGQTTAEDSPAPPSPAEIAAAVGEARRLGALGITFFDWGGTNRAQFAALARSRW